MTNKLLIPILSVLFFSASTFAEVTVKVPSAVTIYVANGKSPELTGGVFDSQKTLHLPNGTQQILFRYEPFFSKGSNNIGVESDVLVSTFQVSNQNLQLVVPKFRGLKDARKNIHSFKWSLTTENGKQIETINDKLIKKGVQFGRNYLTEASLYNQSNHIAAVHAFAPHTTLAESQIQTSSQQEQSINNTNQPKPVVGGPSVESMLHYWYSQADTETKVRFKSFINNQ
ncbi:DUF2057 family protein [Vibrio salinus]|uniref:DUF2057 family protein n=1 Tax=Vibrio salinus TaxID=2899784 RepID=UPI001E556508|nr:DUF2057 family protein [Vibrio salinus]MCE0495368.1 DUF2057 family protein [Vibrio salinus]